MDLRFRVVSPMMLTLARSKSKVVWGSKNLSSVLKCLQPPLATPTLSFLKSRQDQAGDSHLLRSDSSGCGHSGGPLVRRAVISGS